VEPDDSEAVRWYRLAAEQGYAFAQFNLGVRYDNGKGVEPDDSEAVRWYRFSAEQGYAKAQYTLGERYKTGRGVEQNHSLAAHWFLKASDQGHSFAKKELKNMDSSIVEKVRSGTKNTQIGEAGSSIIHTPQSSSPNLLEAYLEFDGASKAVDSRAAEGEGKVTFPLVLDKVDWENLGETVSEARKLRDELVKMKREFALSPAIGVSEEERERRLHLDAQLKVLVHKAALDGRQIAEVKRLKQEPNLRDFYRTFQTVLGAMFVSTMSVSGGYAEVSDKTRTRKGAKGLKYGASGVTLLGEVIEIVPLVGKIISWGLKGAGYGLDKLGKTRYKNEAKRITSLATLTEFQVAAEKVAKQLVAWYRPQLEKLAIMKEHPPGVVAKGGEKALNREVHSGAHQVAEYAAFWVIQAFQEGRINDVDDLDEQFLQVITSKRSFVGKMKDKAKGALASLEKKLGLHAVWTKQNKKWHLHDFFTKPGVKTPEGRLYGGNGTDSNTYSYCDGGDKLAQRRGLQLLIQTAVAVPQPKPPTNPSPAGGVGGNVAVLTAAQQLSDHHSVKELSRSNRVLQNQVRMLREQNQVLMGMHGVGEAYTQILQNQEQLHAHVSHLGIQVAHFSEQTDIELLEHTHPDQLVPAHNRAELIPETTTTTTTTTTQLFNLQEE